MSEIEAHLDTIESWRTAQVQVSKEIVVRELYNRTTPIFKTLLETIQRQEQRISKLQEQINICTT